jgi:PAS domain S-box-containing protein
MNEFVEKASEKIDKLSDEQLKRIFDSAREESEIFDSIIQSIPSGLIVVNDEWRIRKINKAAKRYISFLPLHKESAEPVWSLIDDEEISAFIFSCAKNNLTGTEEEFSVTAADGKTRFVSVSVMPFVRNEKIEGRLILAEDVTSKRQQEILSHRMEKLNSLTNLAASVAHEIKNPLGAISIHIQLLQKAVKKSRESDGILPDEKFMEKYLEIVTEEIENLNKIVMDFLFAVRPLQANLILCDPDSLIEKYAEFFAPELSSLGIQLSVETGKNSVRLLIDEKLFKEILINIVQNAKSAVEGKIGGKIFVKTFVRGENYFLTIADNGSGMTSETCSRIFEPYYTTKADGTGLGLTTVYKIVKEFRGDISVNSEPGKGTVFTIQIPVPQKETKMIEAK